MTMHLYRQDRPLSDEQIAKYAPAVFAQAPAEHVSDKYTFIPTSQVVTKLREAGFEPVAVSQHGARARARENTARHCVRFRLPGAPKAKAVGDTFPEVVVINGHDASVSYRIMAGLFRLVCLNGMVTGTDYDSFRVVHQHRTAMEVLEASEKLVEDTVPRIYSRLEEMKDRQLTELEQRRFASQALSLRWEHFPLISTKQLLTRHRVEDAANDLWTTFNVVQENLTNRVHTSERNTRVGPVQQVQANTRLNQRLWDLAEDYLEAA